MSGRLRHKAKLEERRPLDLLEEAVWVLQTAPFRSLCIYYVGTFPFVFGFLYFVFEMTQGAFAYERCAPWALGLALLYLGMKWSHAIFSLQLRSWRSNEEMPTWNWRLIWSLLTQQTAWQATSWVVLPLAFLMQIPLGWVYAFYHNISVYRPSRGEGRRERPFSFAVFQAALWPKQNHLLMLIYSLFVGVVFLNVFCIVVMLPQLFKSLFGIDSIFTQNPIAMLLNPTVLFVSGGVTYLLTNPLIKTVYVLRCYYGDSISSGEDLRADFFKAKRFKDTMVGLGIFMLISCAGFLRAEEGKEGSSTKELELDESIVKALRQPEFSWRSPRAPAPTEKGVLGSFLDDTAKTIRDAFVKAARWVNKMLNKIERWLNRHLHSRESEGSSGSMDWVAVSKYLLLLLILIFVVVGIGSLWRVWNKRRKVPGELVAKAEVSLTPDLKDEKVQADQLPFDRWQALAEELIAQGEFRLALRALYLSSLAYLAQAGMIAIVRSKSNRDYERELQRRAYHQTEILAAFSENVHVFERSWYGMHEVDLSLLTHFQQNHQMIQQR